MNTAKSAV
jgi:hypothetical protein